ncbi:MAG TPA: carboxymuconolactone decarboxylase family protein [Mycobacteriales bacterium]|jgi:alkylhydroperoxidase family enzyme|nr:carboxymuconolactone decarboxylase family protein [Mycobacteriales bacterium]
MDARLNIFENPVALKAAKYITSAGHVITDAILPTTTQELVKLRASQINGCGFCAAASPVPCRRFVRGSITRRHGSGARRN